MMSLVTVTGVQYNLLTIEYVLQFGDMQTGHWLYHLLYNNLHLWYYTSRAEIGQMDRPG